MTECEQQQEIPVEDIFRQMRGFMGHHWGVGTFGDPPPKIIEGKYSVVDPKLPKLVPTQQLTSSETG